jgi:signal recognition particle GTPase
VLIPVSKFTPSATVFFASNIVSMRNIAALQALECFIMTKTDGEARIGSIQPITERSG